MKLLILGGGFTGVAVAHRALSRGAEVVATTRSEARAESLRALGVTPLVAPKLDAHALAPHLGAETHVVVTFPPGDAQHGSLDAELADSITKARENKGIGAVVYVSSTGVYGNASGRVDEITAVDPEAARAAPRLDAEAAWKKAGATIVRAPGIYGPGRGMHLRLARGEIHSIDGGTNSISRIHVADLAAALLALLALSSRGETFVIGDHEPAPHIDVVRFLCEKLGLPMPPVDTKAPRVETLSHDRRIDAARLWTRIDSQPEFPTYREGYAQCIASDGLSTKR